MCILVIYIVISKSIYYYIWLNIKLINIIYYRLFAKKKALQKYNIFIEMPFCKNKIFHKISQ